MGSGQVTGQKIGSLPGQTQQDSTNVAKNNLRIQMGVGRIPGGGGVEISESVIFPVPFLERPFVVANAIGFQSTGGSYQPDSLNTSWAGQHANASGPTPTGFVCRMRRNDGGSFSITADYYYNWVAIGEV